MTPQIMIEDFINEINELAESHLQAVRANSSTAPRELIQVLDFADTQYNASETTLKLVIYYYRREFFASAIRSSDFLDVANYFFEKLDDYAYFIQGLNSDEDPFDSMLDHEDDWDDIKDLLPTHISEHPKLSLNTFKAGMTRYFQALDSAHASIFHHWFNADRSFNNAAYQNEFTNFLLTFRDYNAATLALIDLPIDDPLQDRFQKLAIKFNEDFVLLVLELPQHQNIKMFQRLSFELRHQFANDINNAYAEETKNQSIYHQQEKFSELMHGLHNYAWKLEKYGLDWMAASDAMRMQTRAIQTHVHTTQMLVPAMQMYLQAPQMPAPAMQMHVSPSQMSISSMQMSVKEKENENDENNAQDDNIVFADSDEDGDMKWKSPHSSPSRGSKRRKN